MSLESALLDSERNETINVVSTMLLVLQARHVVTSIEDHRTIVARMQTLIEGMQKSRALAAQMNNDLSNKVAIVQAAVIHVMLDIIPSRYGLQQQLFDDAAAATRAELYQES